jgi:SAM-dependent MidA family methyltransferase
MKAGLKVTFEQFMGWALHDPKHGYYARRISKVGQGGDFTTAPMLSDSTALAIASWAVSAMRETGCWNLIELGPGQGTLAAAVRRFLPWHIRWKTRLHLVETSGPLEDHQRTLLGRRAKWHKSLKDALTDCGGRAVIYSNEFVDAFPVRRFRKTAEGWQELAIQFDDERRAHESLLPPAPLPASSAFLENHPMDQWVEVHESYQRYLSEWMPDWKAGRMLTIDYGSTADRLYHRKPRGTIRAYLLQQRLEGTAIYENPGRQDLTTDVNFTDLQNWSEPWVDDQKLQTFREFTHVPGIPIGNADRQLHEAQGAGDAFLVLDQRCGARSS